MSTAGQIVRRRRRRYARQAQQNTINRNWLILSLVFILIAFVLPGGGILAGAAVPYLRALQVLPTPQQTIFVDDMIGATEIYDESGQTLLFAVQDPLGEERRWIAFDDLPDYLIEATVLAEDVDFRQTTGFNLFTVIEKLWANLLSGPLEADTSLTGRLVRNAILSQQEFVTVDERGIEIALIAEINRLYSPQAILEWHLNTNYYGNEAYGIEAAAQVYLGKSARDLTLDEVAMLAAIPTAPQFNPVDDETAARGRQSNLLRRLLAEDVITQTEFEQVSNINTVILQDAGQVPAFAPEFARYARQQAEDILTSLGWDGAQRVARDGLRITTTLDIDLYTQAECTLQAHLSRLGGQGSDATATDTNATCFGVAYLSPVDPIGIAAPDTGSIVMLDAETGEIRAMVGPATALNKQPGPTLHPFIYLDGFLSSDPNYTPATMLLDIPRPLPGAADGLLYIPNNADGLFRGPISLRDSMSVGLLPPVTQVANVLNLNNILRRTVAQMGIDSLREGRYDLSLLERGGSVSVIDMTYAYSIFAAMGVVNGLPIDSTPGGLSHVPVAVRRIEDAQGVVLWEYDDDQIALSRAPLLQREVAYLVNDILADSATRRQILGQNNPLEIQREVAVVNGQTSNFVDNWTIGYTPQLVVGVWLGREDNAPTALEGYATEGAATLWRAMLDYVNLRDALPPAEWPRPETIVQAPVCEISGLAPNDACETRTEIFLSQAQLPPPDTYWQIVEVNSQTGQRITANTPSALRDARQYFIPPPEAMDWWRANNRPLPPEDYDTASRPDIFSSAVILRPENLEIVGGEVSVIGSIDTEGFDFYQVAFGQGPSPAEWSDITGQRDEFTPGVPLAVWNTTGLDGTYVLRLSVVLEDGTLETGTAQVIVDNIPPSVVLTTNDDRQIYRWPEDDTISLVAEVADNFRVDRVEFYQNGQFVGIDETFPYGYDHGINRPGNEVFTAVVFDAVGNSSQSELSIEIVRDS